MPQQRTTPDRHGLLRIDLFHMRASVIDVSGVLLLSSIRRSCRFANARPFTSANKVPRGGVQGKAWTLRPLEREQFQVVKIGLWRTRHRGRA